MKKRPRDTLDLMSGQGLDQFCMFYYGIQRIGLEREGQQLETDDDYRERCRNIVREQAMMRCASSRSK